MKVMKAIIKHERGTGLKMIDAPKPEYGINDVLIKIKKTSICGTDVHIYNWDEWAQRISKPLMVIGHEFVGTVEAFGSNVHDVNIGDLSAAKAISLRALPHCLAGRRHLSQHQRRGANRDGALRNICHSGDQCLALQPGHPRRRAFLL
jgi:threonine 3-dehydrogenase